jgi:hypothetical protein
MDKVKVKRWVLESEDGTSIVQEMKLNSKEEN